MSKKPMGFDIAAPKAECEDCEEPELTEVQDGQHSEHTPEVTPFEMAELFLESVEKLRAMGATEIAMFDCAVKFGGPPEKAKIVKEPRPTERKAKPLVVDLLPGDTEEDLERRKRYAKIANGMVDE